MKAQSIIVIILSISYCGMIQSAEKEIPKDRADLFIQLTAESEMLHGFRTEMAYVINNIVKEELEKIGLEKNYYFDFFEPKPLQRLSVYYFYGVDVTKKEALLLKVEEIAKKLVPQEVVIKADIKFFGEYGNEFVMVIEGKGLTDLNGKFKEMATSMRKEYGKSLYNIDKSEQFAFVPHTGIGMLRINRIADHIRKLKSKENEDFATKIISKIKERIEKAVGKYIVKIPREKRIITFKTIGIFDPKSRKPQNPSCTGYLKEYVLGD